MQDGRPCLLIGCTDGPILRQQIPTHFSPSMTRHLLFALAISVLVAATVLLLAEAGVFEPAGRECKPSGFSSP